jgi:hypothetical protein
MAANHYRMKVLTGRVTGSIHKVCSVHASTALTIADSTLGHFGGALNGIVVDSGSVAIDINHVNSNNRVDQTTTTDIVVPIGKCIDGPIIALNASAGTALIYYSNDLAITGS